PVVGPAQVPAQRDPGEQAGQADQGRQRHRPGHAQGPGCGVRRASATELSSAGSRSARGETYDAVKVSTPVPRCAPGRYVTVTARADAASITPALHPRP